MGDTQRSPTISTENQGIAAKVAGDSGHGLADPPGEGPPLFEGESSLLRIRMLAESEPDLVFTSVVDRIDLYLLKKSFRQVRKYPLNFTLNTKAKFKTLRVHLIFNFQYTVT